LGTVTDAGWLGRAGEMHFTFAGVFRTPLLSALVLALLLAQVALSIRQAAIE
jgi:hypothetical protein